MLVRIRSGFWRYVERPIGAVAGPLLLASGLSAQTLPVPTLPPEQPPETGKSPQTPATRASVSTTAPPSARWEYGLGVGVGYDSNIDFRVPDGPSGSALSPRGNVARVFRSPQGKLRLGGMANWIGYPNQEALNRYNAGLDLDGSYRSSVNTTWLVGTSYMIGYSDHSRVLNDQGVLLPLVQTRTATAGLDVTRTVGLQTSLGLKGRFYRTEFDQQDIDTYGLRNGQSLRATTGLQRRFGLRNSAGGEYALEAVGKEGTQSYLTHFGSLQWNHVLSPRSGFLLEAGGSYTPESAEAGLSRKGHFYGGVSYSRQVRLSSVTFVARREVVPAFGLGVSRIQNRLGLSASIPIRRHWTLALSGTRRTADSAETPEGTSLVYGSRADAFVGLTRSLGRHFEVSTEGRYRRRGAAGTVPEIEQYAAGVFLSLVSSSGSSGSSGGRSGR